MSPTLVRVACALLLLLGVAPARPDPVAVEPDARFPEALRAWKGWVLRDDPELACPLACNQPARFCVWPGTLSLRITGDTATFEQPWQVYRRTAVILPATDTAWPGEVTVDDAPAPTTEQDGRPRLWLAPGEHRVQGRLHFPRRPTAFDVDPRTTTFTLYDGNRRMDGSTPEGAGRIWIQGSGAPVAQTEADFLGYEAFRKWTDGIPQRLESHYRLKAAGNPREVVIGPVLPEGFQPLRLTSPLPARIEAGNRVRLQLQPGTWTLEAVGRAPRQQNRLDYFPATDGFGKGQEVWVVETQPELRQLDIAGDRPLDPQQTLLPSAWKDLPAFLMGPGQALRLTEKRRGDPTPAPNHLSLTRTLWLDMGGQGWSIRDLIEGEVNRGWRLNVLPALDLGRVTLEGQPQYITRDQAGRVGVELRQGRIRLVGESRIRGMPGQLPASGWTEDFAAVETSLHLPPGWRLLHAQGVDRVSDSWVERWTLLDLFLLLMIAAAFLKLWGPLWALLAFAGLGLTFETPGAPLWVWVHLLVAVGLLRVLPAGRMRRWIGWYKGAGLLALLLIALPFILGEIRAGIYPQLGAPATPAGSGPLSSGLALLGSSVDTLSELPMAMPEQAPAPEPTSSALPYLKRGAAKTLPSSPQGGRARVQQLDPNAQIQTGPGMPTWTRYTSRFQWTGPVEAGQQIALWLLPPRVNLLLAVVTALLLLLLIYRVLDTPPGEIGRRGARYLKGAAAAAPILAVALLGSVFAPSQAQADIPDPELLKAYRETLIKAPACHPHCAVLAALRVAIDNDRLSLALGVHAAERVAVPLPIQIDQWQPSEVSLDGKPVGPLLRDGDRVWLMLEQGVHELLIRAPLAGRNALTLPLSIPLHNVDLALQGWQASGVRDGQPIAAAIQLRRQAESAEAGIPPTALPPFARIERTFHFGLDWGVETLVRRLSDHSSDILLHYPLLPGESVTTPGIAVTDGAATLALGPSQDEARFSSALPLGSALTLTAGDGRAWVEDWTLDAGPIWHVEASGLPPVRHPAQGRAGPRQPLYRPLPGERLTLAISRPGGVPGPTTTLNRIGIEVTPGRRVTEYEARLRLLSSQGGRHTLGLPPGARLQGLKVDGRERAIDAEAKTIDIALHPGEQEIQLRWRMPGAMGLSYGLPPIRFGLPLNNIEVSVRIPEHRWVWWARGPVQGPAVLFWATLLVIALLAAALGYSRRTPLGPLHWMLLGIGLAPVSLMGVLVVAAGFFALAAKGQVRWERRGTAAYNFTQGTLLLLTLAAAAALTGGIEHGLLGYPDMQIAGNGSSGHLLKWYLDRSAEGLPEIQILSVSLWLYRLLMLGWAIWLALHVIRWSGWAWQQWSRPETWRKIGPLWRRRQSVNPGPTGG